jgi:hypothetical protein
VLRISPSFPVSESECNESHARARLSCELGFNCAEVKQWWYGVTRSPQTVCVLSENCPRIIRRQERDRAEELEIKLTRKGDVGSNHSLSANKLTARISPPNIYPQICKLFPGQNFSAIWSSKTLRLRRQVASINCWASAFALEQTVKRGDSRLAPGRNTPMTLPQDLCYVA